MSILPFELISIILRFRTEMILSGEGYRNWCISQKEELWIPVHGRIKCMGLWQPPINQNVDNYGHHTTSPPKILRSGNYVSWSRWDWAKSFWESQVVNPCPWKDEKPQDIPWDLSKHKYRWAVYGYDLLGPNMRNLNFRL